MKKYPKVPRHELEFVPEEIFTSEDMVILEKMDGMNFRFTLYEKRYHDEYSDQVLEVNPEDGEIVFGTKSVVRGVVEDGSESFSSELKTGINKIRELDKSQISSYQDKYGPLVWFCENMVPHTLDYDYENDPPPRLIGYDIYCSRKDNRKKEDYNPNPYKEKFIGYLEWNKVENMFSNIGINPTRCFATQKDFENGFNTEEFTIPMSQYASVKAEGVVIRSDKLKRRTKYIRESFREMHKSGMGSNANKRDDPEQWILDSIITNQRIRKTIRKLIKQDDSEFSRDKDFINKISQIVIYDGWQEEFSEIRTIDSPIKPSRLHSSTYRKVQSVVERMDLMSKRTGEKPEDTWKMLDQDEKLNIKTEFDNAFVDISEIELSLTRSIKNGDSPEKAIVEEFIDEDTIKQVAKSESENRDLGGWAVSPMTDTLEDILWTSDRTKSSLWRLHIEFNPSRIRDLLREKVKRYIEDITDEDLDKGGGSWEPKDSDFSFEGFSNF